MSSSSGSEQTESVQRARKYLHITPDIPIRTKQTETKLDKCLYLQFMLQCLSLCYSDEERK